MRDELDSEGQWQRLVDLYRAMSDEELLGLAERPGDLTEMAQGVLRSEMGSRNLKLEVLQPETGHRWASDSVAQERWPGSAMPAFVLGSAPVVDAPGGEDEDWMKPGEAWLGVFHDAFEVDRACHLLEENDVPFRLHDSLDRSRPRRGTRADGPGVALNLIVSGADRERAKAILRKNMGLFPLQEVAEADPIVDDGTVSTVGTFGRRDDADMVANALDEAGIWHRLVSNPEGSVANEDAWTLEVKEVDLVRAGDAAVKAIRLPEG
jgi:hypothetical protein